MSVIISFFKKYLLSTLLFLFCQQLSIAQQKKNVLFIGNSYTAYNNLPQLTANVALSAGDTLTFDSNTPGGQTFQGHSTNSQTLAKIQAGGWDFVVLQEQSQLPSFPIQQVQNQVFPFARKLDSLIHAATPCAQTLFYMTWGRKNGDANNCQFLPDLCTYEGMDNLLRERYMMMTNDNNAQVSPVGAVWRYLREHHPGIELYQSDESHPTLEGSYVAACAFYTAIFRKNPELITFNAGIPSTVANQIKQAAKLVVYDSLAHWKIGIYDPVAAFSYTAQTNQLAFENTSQHATDYLWDFGDGSTSTEQNPTHIYTAVGSYTVTLIARHCGQTDTFEHVIPVQSLAVPSTDNTTILVYPNPVNDQLHIRSSGTAEVQLLDLTGRTVLTGVVATDGKSTLLLHQVPNGHYTLKIRIGEHDYFKQVIKQ
ncbi:PKD domain-containing protein [Fluviicola sp. SGL-29]|nr:PKD domain-containing protein [Fluviicola sp. SGL-29]